MASTETGLPQGCSSAAVAIASREEHDMAYLDLREPAAAQSANPAGKAAIAVPHHDPQNGAADFDRMEWGVIALAQHDGLASLGEPGRVARALAWLFGGRPPFRLADPRLEALRRLAVLAWHHGYAVPVSAVKAFKAAGYTVDHLELMLANISIRRPVFRGRTLA